MSRSARLVAALPADKVELWDWCMSADRKTLMDVLAFCVAALPFVQPLVLHACGASNKGLDERQVSTYI